MLPAGTWEHMAGHMAEFGAAGFVDPAARPSCSDKTRRGGGSSSISAPPNTVRESWDKARRQRTSGHTHTNTHSRSLRITQIKVTHSLTQSYS